MPGAALNRHNSRQTYQTPPEFLAAVEKRFGQLGFDVAAEPDTAVTPWYWTAEDDAFTKDWAAEYYVRKGVGLPAMLWLNPPYSNIEPWAKRCLETAGRGAEVLLLVPASVGSNWYRDHVHGKADIYYLNGRITFVGASDPYPKDLMLVHYHLRALAKSKVVVWRWRDDEVY